MEDENLEVINISELDPNNTPAASDMLATETKSEKAVQTTFAQIAEFTNGITGTCDTLAAEAVKTVILADYDSNVIPREFDVVFVHKNTYGDVVNDDVYPTMTILNKNNQEIASNIPIADSRGHNAGALCWNDNDIMSFKFMAGKVCIMNSNVRQVTDSYTLFSDGSTAYNKPQIDNNYVHKEDGKGLFSGEYEDLNNKPAIPENVLKYVAQLLTEEQKQQAAANIGIPDTYATIEEVTAIENKIPDQASEENQLADKDFVNSSIASNTAYFIGNFDTLEELENQTETPVTLNDYAFVKGTDSEGNLVYKRYKYTGTEWLFEYDLNNSSFTAQQWAVINSGITADKVAEIDETVRFTAQDLTDEQKAQARANIGAGTSNLTIGTTGSTACAGNDSRLSNARPASDVSAWAKAATKPTYTASEVGALPSNTSIPTSSTVSGWGFTKNAGTVTSVAVKMNNTTKGTVTTSGTIDLGTVLTAHQSLDGYIKESAKSIGQSGYLKLTNGLIIQWGQLAKGSDLAKGGSYDFPVTMPIAFTNSYSLNLTIKLGGTTGTWGVELSYVTDSSEPLRIFKAHLNSRNDAALKTPVLNWIAIGY